MWPPHDLPLSPPLSLPACTLSRLQPPTADTPPHPRRWAPTAAGWSSPTGAWPDTSPAPSACPSSSASSWCVRPALAGLLRNYSPAGGAPAVPRRADPLPRPAAVLLCLLPLAPRRRPNTRGPRPGPAHAGVRRRALHRLHRPAGHRLLRGPRHGGPGAAPVGQQVRSGLCAERTGGTQGWLAHLLKHPPSFSTHPPPTTSFPPAPLLKLPGQRGRVPSGRRAPAQHWPGAQLQAGPGGHGAGQDQHPPQGGARALAGLGQGWSRAGAGLGQES